MRILMTSPIFPYPLESGGHTRLFHLIKHLSRRHEITLLSFLLPHQVPHTDTVRAYCRDLGLVLVRKEGSPLQRMKTFANRRKVRDVAARASRFLKGLPYDVARLYFTEMSEKMKAAASRISPDIIHIDFVAMEQYAAPLRREAKQVLVEVDLSFLPLKRAAKEGPLPRRLHYLSRYRSMKRFSQEAWRRVDRVVAVSDLDRERIRDLSPDLEVSTVPNGVELAEFDPISSRNGGSTLLFVGAMEYSPNEDALIHFVREIFPLILEKKPDVSLTVVGPNPPRKVMDLNKHPSITVTGYVPDLNEYFRKSTLLVAPVRVGGGTRLKVLEAMAAGLPVVASSVGCEGIDAVPDEEILVADDPGEFRDKVLFLLGSRDKQVDMAAKALTLVREHHSWESIAGRLETIYGDLVEK